ncbi:hypothetical protein DLM46_22880 [Paraburkholderia lacunae]|uniref:Uncharacterized protein n=2 Tax=Paraburkholderia lacunae TaxID=2211104 RepID=A0A370N4K7_9BURK|nr:hypothetical protein DLM46_22880 [Paraburkholderia lacunae]
MIRKGAVAMAILLMVAAPLISEAKQTTKSLAVATTVQPYVKIAATQPAQLVITNKDVNLGYVDIPDTSNLNGTQLAVQTNDRAGYSLLFRVSAANQPLFSSIEVIGLGTTAVLPASGGTINMTYSGLNTNFKITYRLILAKKVKDGTYTWPFAMSAQPN